MKNMNLNMNLNNTLNVSNTLCIRHINLGYIIDYTS